VKTPYTSDKTKHDTSKEWISVKDELPKDGQRVWMRFYYAGMLAEAPSSYTDGKFVMAFYSSNIIVKPTHWYAI